MNPSSNNQSMELPPPVLEKPAAPETSHAESQQSLESPGAASHEQAAASSVAAAMPVMPVSVPTAVTPQISTSAPSDDAQAVSDNKMLQDKDLIEKEWVNKAKSIIEKTKEDPYQQNENLSMLKADYMKKQFNKSIKLNK